jgi:hypothetical protein
MEADRKAIQMRRRRGIILKMVREGHEHQLSRMDNFEVWAVLQKMGQGMGREQVDTLLQDLAVLDYLDFKTAINEMTGNVEISQIVLTAAGLRFVTAGRSNDDVLFN